MIELILYYIGLALCFMGAFFFISGGIGLVRMPDVYNRMQASTKTTTLGLMSVVLGVGLMQPGWIVKALVIIIFIAVTAPVGASAMARAAYKGGIPLWEKTEVNECDAPVCKKEVEE
ncbi:MAG: monovalent cation/H(+) antiporter subunit G [Euryarchaeota archaeon]|nr:monovalent cation/H(+) antiporter subunit G [Euryarchaeota archaeon]